MVQQLLTPHTLITFYSVEGIFFGMNCVLYAFCAYTLWGQKSVSCRLLLFINTMQFLLCAAQVTLHTIFLFLLFTVVTNVLAYLHQVNDYLLGSCIIYNINFLITEFLSIWRLYVLYDNDLRACIPALLFWVAQICASGMTIHLCITVSIIATNYKLANLLLWVFITVVNLCVAIPICYRLYIAQKKKHAILSRSPYKSIAIILVECGALVTFCSIAMLILLVHDYAYALVGLGVASEFAVASQLLITARHGMLSQGGDTSNPSSSSLQTKVGRTEAGQVDVPPTPMKTKSLRSSIP